MASLALVYQLHGVGALRQRMLGAFVRGFSSNSSSSSSSGANAMMNTAALDLKDFNHVRTEIHRIAREHELGNQLPSTQLLKELGQDELIRAIRKKHGGFHAVAERLGWPKDDPDNMQQKLRARQHRRTKRKHHLAQHHIFKHD